MKQKVSGWRMWSWGVLALCLMAVLVMFAALQMQGYSLTGVNPRLFLVVLMFVAIGVGCAFFMRSKTESRRDLR